MAYSALSGIHNEYAGFTQQSSPCLAKRETYNQVNAVHERGNAIKPPAQHLDAFSIDTSHMGIFSALFYPEQTDLNSK
jgi:hypothetical protein